MSNKNTVLPYGSGRQVQLCLNISPQPKITRAREPVQRTKGRVVGYYPSTKSNRQIAWESQLEQKACNLFEFSPVVASYREQPITISFPSEGKLLKYTPDFELTIPNGNLVYVEIKPASKLLDLGLKTRLIDIDTYFRGKDHKFILITDEELYQPIRQRNLTLLRRYLSHQCDENLIHTIKEYLTKNTTLTFENLVSLTGSVASAHTLIALRHVSIDIDQPIELSSELTLNQENNHETCLFAYRTAPNFEGRSI
jgi:hypothetical protein